ncbi:methyltransferase [Caulobacter sp. SLTY]|uniref:class I SAM-dependent methyltransferase n=1 Tax=Caulobacter sp. SLTY TaxID=2683262 RepID=UPI001412CB0E|nr:class I SAM-dependent methyltransferase [Caulobacter sp. SLTY]NBB16087.1 methyltransferase [Caulobacter sp. SLTY]
MRSSLVFPSRRALLVGGAAAVLAACGEKKGEAEQAKPVAPRKIQTIAEAVAGEWRRPEDKARDAWRHPVESLTFWGLQPGQTVVEFWPGAGWYTDILAPFLDATGGKLYAANLEADDPQVVEVIEAYKRKLADNKKIYGDVEVTAFGPTTGPVAPAGSADLVLFLRNLHNWMAAGIADKAFRDAFAALKPGGFLGIEEHRGVPGAVQDPLAADGYVQQDYAIALAKEAGFQLVAANELNANPKDDKSHPFGVWTLPPTRLSAPRGQSPKAGFDHAPYDAIGESDRMTLKLVKPK